MGLREHGVMDIDETRRELDEKESALRAQLGLLDRPVDPDAVIGFGKRIGEGTTEAITRMEDASSAQALLATLDQVQRARTKLDEGTHGTCDVCGRPIGDLRLEFRPWSTTCVEHAG